MKFFIVLALVSVAAALPSNYQGLFESIITSFKSFQTLKFSIELWKTYESYN